MRLDISYNTCLMGTQFLLSLQNNCSSHSPSPPLIITHLWLCHLRSPCSEVLLWCHMESSSLLPSGAKAENSPASRLCSSRWRHQSSECSWTIPTPPLPSSPLQRRHTIRHNMFGFLLAEKDTELNGAQQHWKRIITSKVNKKMAEQFN